MTLRIIFMGTPDFAVPALQKLIASEHDVIAVYSQPPRPKGRGHQVQKSPVHLAAEDVGIPVYHPVNFKTPEAVEEFQSLNADIAVVAAYGLILPVSVLEAPKHGCLNIHASLLPRWRGASPIQHAIWKGDKVSGVTIMQMEKGLDTGPMIVKGEVEITPDMTASRLHDELAEIGGNLVLDVLDVLDNSGDVLGTPQDHENMTYAPMLKKEDGKIDWNVPAYEIDWQVRALNPWPGTWMEIAGKRFKIKGISLVRDGMSATGNPHIIDAKGHVLCGDGGVLRIDMIQPEGAKAMDFVSAVNGGYIEVGTQLQ
jgi:methionyl-tRNA formyltransferase